MKQNKNLLSSRLTENRIDDQNIIQSNTDLSNQKSSAPISDKKQYKTWGKRKKKEEPAYFQYADSSNLTDRNLEDYAEIRDNTKMKRGNLHTRIINFILIAGCIYLLVLIFGAAVTKYQYNSDGKAVPEKMSVDDIRQKHNFDTILTQYEYCRSLYEKTLLLDYRVAQGQEDTLEIAPEYEALLDDVQNLSVKTDAISVDTKYDQVKSMMVNWIKNDIAVYLQNISAAISENNTEKANNALQDKDRVYDDFSLITQNIVALGSSISGADLTDIKSWTPEDYVDQEINSNAMPIKYQEQTVTPSEPDTPETPSEPEQPDTPETPTLPDTTGTDTKKNNHQTTVKKNNTVTSLDLIKEDSDDTDTKKETVVDLSGVNLQSAILI